MPEEPLTRATRAHVPRWRRPHVRVTSRDGQVLVTQRVPGVLAGTSRLYDGDGDIGTAITYDLPYYASGLGRRRSRTRMVEERLSVPLASVGSLEAARRVVDGVLAGPEHAERVPRRGGVPGPSQEAAPGGREPDSAGTVLAMRLIVAAVGLAWCAIVVGLMVVPTRLFGGSPVLHPNPFAPRSSYLLVLVTFVVLLGSGLLLLLVPLRRAWADRTPDWYAEAQWEALRRALWCAAGAEPASSRWSDVEGEAPPDPLLRR